jgi:uncharacterized protein DUF2752
MQISAQRLAPKETDYELLWLGVSVCALVVGVTWFALHLPWPTCTFRALTGLPCVTCGATRAAIQFLHGHFIAAWIFNPLISAGLCAIALFDFYAVFVLVTGAPRLRIAHLTQNEKIVTRVLVIGFLASNWIYLLGHPPA